MKTLEKKSKEEFIDNLTEIFEECGSRAAYYDSNNLFFQEDFEVLKNAGYLTMAVPEEFGGMGFQWWNSNE